MDYNFKASLRKPPTKPVKWGKTKVIEPHSRSFHSNSIVKRSTQQSPNKHELPPVKTRKYGQNQATSQLIQRGKQEANEDSFDPINYNVRRMRLITDSEREELYQNLFWKVSSQTEEDITVKDKASRRVQRIYQQEFELAEIEAKNQLRERIARRKAIIQKIEEQKQKLLQELLDVEEGKRFRPSLHQIREQT